MQRSIFNFPFPIVIYQPVLGNNCNNVFYSVFSSCIVILLQLFSKRRVVTISCIVYIRYNQLKQINIRITKWRKISAPKIKQRSHKECSCCNCPAHSMFTFDVFWGSLRSSIFGNCVVVSLGSSAANNAQSRQPSRLSFLFWWLCLKPLLKKVSGTIILHVGVNNCVNESSNNVLDKTLSSKKCIKERLTESETITLNLIEVLDNGKVALSVKRLNEHLDIYW